MRTQAGKTTLYSLITVVTLITIIVAGWFALNSMLKITRNMLKNSGVLKSKIPDKKQTPVIKTTKETRKVLLAYFQDKESVKKISDSEKIQNNENIAKDMLVKYTDAQQVYISNTGSYAKDCSELFLKKGDSFQFIDPDLQIMDAAYNQQYAKNGYYFIETVRDSIGSRGKDFDYVVCAVPADYGVTGLQTFCIDSKKEKVVFKKNNSARPVFYSEEITTGWEKF